MSDEAKQRATEAAIAGVWLRMRPTVLARFTAVEQALAAARDGALEEGLREQALHEAHKLAGSLGMFGFPEGSDLAKELEKSLRQGLGAAAAARFIERLGDLKTLLGA
ncbi:MAG TPA: Hpt domain-containing protein [Stenomitos sp.]